MRPSLRTVQLEDAVLQNKRSKTQNSRPDEIKTLFCPFLSITNYRLFVSAPQSLLHASRLQFRCGTGHAEDKSLDFEFLLQINFLLEEKRSFLVTVRDARFRADQLRHGGGGRGRHGAVSRGRPRRAAQALQRVRAAGSRLHRRGHRRVRTRDGTGAVHEGESPTDRGRLWGMGLVNSKVFPPNFVHRVHVFNLKSLRVNSIQIKFQATTHLDIVSSSRDVTQWSLSQICVVSCLVSRRNDTEISSVTRRHQQSAFCQICRSTFRTAIRSAFVQALSKNTSCPFVRKVGGKALTRRVTTTRWLPGQKNRCAWDW